MKKIVTHISPHLDEILSIWLIKKFDPAWGEFEVKFKATNPAGGEVPLDEVDKDPEIIYLGLGRGKYDEHALEKDEASVLSTAVLVWNNIKSRGLAPQDPMLVGAVDKIIGFVLKDDTGELKGMKDYLVDYTITALWDGFSKVHRGDSDKKLEYGLPLIDYMVAYLKGIVNAEEVISQGITFDTTWGPGVAVESEFKETQVVAYRRGFNILISINPKLGYRLILGNPASTVDLTTAYQKLQETDSAADWYLHQSKRMLISGSHSAPNVKVSRLSMDQLINLVKI